MNLLILLKNNLKQILQWLIGALLAASLILMGLTILYLHDGKLEQEFLQIAFEDLLDNVKASQANREEMLATCMENVRRYASLAAWMELQDPKIVETQESMQKIAVLLGVDDLNITDDKGVIIASNVRTGFKMASTTQSAEFMPILDNPSLIIKQRPQIQGGKDKKCYIYAGVARLAKKGIVQAGFNMESLQKYIDMVNPQFLENQVRIRRGGFVKLEPAKENGGQTQGLHTLLKDGRPYQAMSIVNGEFYVTAAIPLVHAFFHRPHLLTYLVISAILFLIALFRVSFASVFSEALTHIRTSQKVIQAAFRNDKLKNLGKSLSTIARRTNLLPLIFFNLLVLVLALGTAWIVEDTMADRKSSKLLTINMDKLKNDMSDTFNSMLFYIGSTIIDHYKSPSALTSETLKDLLEQYSVDELNVVNADNVITASTIGMEGFNLSSNPDTRLFSCLLKKQKAFAVPFRPPVTKFKDGACGFKKGSCDFKFAGVAFPGHDGYLQIGFKKDHLISEFDYYYSYLCKGRSLGEHGFFLCLSENDFQVLSASAPGFQTGDTLASIGGNLSLVQTAQPDQFFIQELYSQKCKCKVLRGGIDHLFIAALPVSEINRDRNTMLLITAVILITVQLIFSAFANRLSFLVEKLRGYITSEKEREKRDMASARQVQASALPPPFPGCPDFDIEACMHPAKMVGGDFYDYYMLPSGKFFFLVADVSGKGISAAMFMMRAKSIINLCIFNDGDLAQAITRANDLLCKNNDASLFVTLWAGLLDPVNGTVTYVNAGHNPPLFCRFRDSGQPVQWLNCTPALALGMMEDMTYSANRLQLGTDESIFLYTDGVTEAQNTEGALYGEERLENKLRADGRLSIDALQKDLKEFADGAEQADDITMLFLTYRGHHNTTQGSVE